MWGGGQGKSKDGKKFNQREEVASSGSHIWQTSAMGLEGEGDVLINQSWSAVLSCDPLLFQVFIN